MGSFSTMNYHNSVVYSLETEYDLQTGHSLARVHKNGPLTMHSYPYVGQFNTFCVKRTESKKQDVQPERKVYGYIWDRLLGDVLSIDIMGNYICYNTRILAFFPGSQSSA